MQKLYCCRLCLVQWYTSAQNCGERASRVSEVIQVISYVIVFSRMMVKPRGRPRLVDEETFIRVVLNYKEQVVQGSHVVSKVEDVWKEISKSLNHKLLPSSCYTMVIQNEYKILDKLLDRIDQGNDSSNITEELVEEHFDNTDATDPNSTFDNSLKEMNFDFHISKEELESITEKKLYNRTNSKGKGFKRSWLVFKAGVYQYFFNNKIWDAAPHLSCGFYVDNSYICLDGTSGTLTGHCSCTSRLRCTISKFGNSKGFLVECNIKNLGNTKNKCGKPYLRKPIRQKVSKEVESKGVEVYRAEKANEFMTQENDPEAPLIFSANVLHVAKSELIADKYLDRDDPIKSLTIMRKGQYANCIESIGSGPIFVRYSTSEQLQIYKKLCANQKVTICIDSTGGLVRKVDKKHIFLHAVAINTSTGQYTLTQMLSEESHAQALSEWLKRWRRYGAPTPDVCVVDWSRALLNAVTQSFTCYDLIDEYAEALRTTDNEQKIFIRLDVAHTMKKYAKYLSNLRKPIKTFYLASIGELIKCTVEEDAEDLIKSLFIVCLSETEGYLSDGRPTRCEQAKTALKQRITDFEIDDEMFAEKKATEDLETDEPSNDEEFNNVGNSWTQRGRNLKALVQILIADKVGDHDNAHFCEKFAEYLIKDMTLLPLWTNILAERFGCDVSRAASSATIESEFNKLKNVIFRPHELPMRLDAFVSKHIDYLLGKMKLQKAQLNEETHTVPVSDEVCSPNNESEISESPVINNNVYAETCPACASDDAPGGAHACLICEKPVHALAECSIACGDEGFGQKRICHTCHKCDDFKKMIALREFDNWKNKGQMNEKIDQQNRKKRESEQNEKKKNKKCRSLYLGEKRSTIKDIMSIEKHKVIPVIKNANSKDVSCVMINGQNISMSNTCAFDTILQLFLIGTYDFEIINTKVDSLAATNDFSKMIVAIRQKGLGSHSYMSRGKILLTNYPEKLMDHPNISDLKLFDAEYNVGAVAQKLLHEHTSYKEVSTCNQGCVPRSRFFPLFNVESTRIADPDFNQCIVSRKIAFQNSNCSKKGCTGKENIVATVDDVVLLDVCIITREDNLEVQKIPQSFQIPDNDIDHLKLCGIVDYKPFKTTRKGNLSGHYTAIFYRRGDAAWFRYDDADASTKRISPKTRVLPALLLLVKQQKF